MSVYIKKKIQRVLLWDVDGVLIDSEPLHVAKLKAVLKRYGLELKDEHMTTPQKFRIPCNLGRMKSVEMQLGGAGDKNIYWWARSRLGDFISQQQWLDELLKFYLDHADNDQSPYKLKSRDNMREMVARLHADGTLQGIVTSGIPEQVEKNLSILGKDLRPIFSFVLNANDVKISKPDPEGYNTGRERALDALEKQCVEAGALAIVAVEDSKPGVIAALASGICCVHFLLPGQRGMTKEEFAKANLDTEALSRYRCVSSGKEVEAATYSLFEAIENGALPAFVESRRYPHYAPEKAASFKAPNL